MKSDEELLEIIDQQSLALAYAKANDDLGWLDHLYWKEWRRLASEEPEKLTASLNIISIAALAAASDDKLERLVSASISSFTYNSDCLETLLFGQTDCCAMISNHRSTSLTKEFLTLARQESLERGVMRTTQMFSVKAEIAAKLKTSNRSKIYEVAERMGAPTIRFSEALLVELLTAPEQNVAALKFKKVQQCLCSGDASLPEINNILQENVACYDTDSNEGRANISLSKELYARSLLVAGHLIKTVGIETGLTLRQVRRINDNVRAAKYDNDATDKLRATRSSNIFIQTSADMLQVSIVMSLYANLGGEDIYKTTNMNAMNTAFSIYCSIRHDIIGIKERLERTIYLPDVWVLAVELRSNHASYTYCEESETLTFVSVNQRTVSSQSPFINPTLAQKTLSVQENKTLL